MKHKRTIIELIEIDIIISKLVNGLTKLGLDSSIYLLDTSSLVFRLMGIDKKLKTDDLYEKYFELIEIDVDIKDKKKLRERALKVYNEVLKQTYI